MPHLWNKPRPHTNKGELIINNLEQKNNKQKTTILILVILLVGSGFVVLMQDSQQSSLADQLNDLTQKTNQLENILHDIQKMVKTYDLEATYIGDNGIALPGNSVTFLSGYVQIGDITSIPQSQLKIMVNYNLMDTHNSTTGVITYDYDTYKEVSLNTSEYEQILIPWGAFPVKLNGFKQGEEITLNLMAQIRITSDYLPPGTYVAEKTISHKYRLVIQK